MSFIPAAFQRPIFESAAESLPRAIARAEAMGDPLGEVDSMKDLLADVTQQLAHLDRQGSTQ